MRVLAKVIGAFVAFIAVLGGTAELIVLFWRWLGHEYFHNVNPTVGAAIVAAAATVTASLLTLVLGRIFERQKALENELRAIKRPVQSALVEAVFTMSQYKSEEGQAIAIEKLNKINKELVTLAPDAVLLEWSRYKQQITKLSPEEKSLYLERILMAIRRDQGYKGRKIREGDLLGIFTTDTDKLFTNKKPRRIPRHIPPLQLTTPVVPESEN